MNKAAFTAALVATIAAPLAAKDSLGIYSNWGAFRDDSPLRCYAISKPSNAGEAQPFASISNWPRQNVRGQVHFRRRAACAMARKRR